MSLLFDTPLIEGLDYRSDLITAADEQSLLFFVADDIILIAKPGDQRRIE